MFFLLLAACPGPKPSDTADAEPRTCDDVAAELSAETAAIQACTEASDCGQILTGTSCGCTRNLVARNDADTTVFYELMAEAGTCDIGFSMCDCPEAYGFECVDGVCAWAYAGSGYYPDCETENGDAFDVDGVVLSGDTLLVTVGYSGGCETHTFTTCWPDGAFAGSSPVQASLELYHDNADDSCEAWITEDVSVDLLPLKTAWQTAYGGGSGTILVHLGGESVTYAF